MADPKNMILDLLSHDHNALVQLRDDAEKKRFKTAMPYNERASTYKLRKIDDAAGEVKYYEKKLNMTRYQINQFANKFLGDNGYTSIGNVRKK